MKKYIHLSLEGERKGQTFSLSEPGSVSGAFDRLMELTAQGESLGEEATSLPLFQFLRDITCPVAPLLVDLSQHKFLSPLFPFAIDPESRWKSEGFLIKGGQHYVANEAVNTLVDWCVHGKVTAEIFELFPPIDVFVRFSDDQSGFDMDVQLTFSSLVLITTPSLAEIRKIFHTEERLARAFGRCSIHDYTLATEKRSLQEPLEIFCKSRPDILKQLENGFFDQYLVETLSYIVTRLKYNEAHIKGILPQFIQDLSQQIIKRGFLYNFEFIRLSQPEHAPSPETQLAIGSALVYEQVQQGLDPRRYSDFVEQRQWKLPQKLSRADQIGGQLVPCIATVLQSQLDQATPRLPLEGRLIKRLRDYMRFILPVTPAGPRMFYAHDIPRAEGVHRQVISLLDQIHQLREPLHATIQEYLRLKEPIFLTPEEVKKIFPDATGNLQIRTFQELLGHGCYLETPSFALFCKICVGPKDVAPLLPIFDQDPMVQLFRVKTDSGIEMQHITCFALYMLTRSKERPCPASLFQDSALTEQRLRLLAIPFYIPHRNKWFTPAKTVLAKADSIQLPPEVKESLSQLVKGLEQSQVEGAFKKLPALEEGAIVSYQEGRIMKALASQANISFDVYLSTVMMQPASKEGLINVGNSCWINASLQALKGILLQQAVIYQNLSDKQHFKETLLEILAHLNLQIAPLERSKLEALRLQLYQSKIHPEFDLKGATGIQQEKALNQMHDPAIFISALLDLFQINIPTRQTLTETGKDPDVRHEPLKVLSVPLGARSLHEAITEYFDSEIGVKKKSIRLEEIPDMLIIQVLRFDNQSLYLKESLKHAVDTLLDMTPYIVKKEGDEQKALYRLSSCIHHHRSPIPHYTAMVSEKGEWGHYDDSKPRKTVTGDEVKADEAYVLIFERMSTNEVQLPPKMDKLES